jgi:hypothetical protein
MFPDHRNGREVPDGPDLGGEPDCPGRCVRFKDGVSGSS